MRKKGKKGEYRKSRYKHGKKLLWCKKVDLKYPNSKVRNKLKIDWKILFDKAYPWPIAPGDILVSKLFIMKIKYVSILILVKTLACKHEDTI